MWRHLLPIAAHQVTVTSLSSAASAARRLEPRTKRRVDGHVRFLFQRPRHSGIDHHFNLAQPVIVIRMQPLTLPRVRQAGHDGLRRLRPRHTDTLGV